MGSSKRSYVGKGRPIKSKDLDDLTFARVVARRIRTLSSKYQELTDAALRDDKVVKAFARGLESGGAVRGAQGESETEARRDQEATIKRYFEKVHQDADFLPAGFLQEGAGLVPAVCRMAVTTPEGER